MFKKNIAKLLVFAMILSMLPFTAAAVLNTTTPGENAKSLTDNTGYITNLDVTVTDGTIPETEKNPTITKSTDSYTVDLDVTPNAGKESVSLDVTYTTTSDVTVVGYKGATKPTDSTQGSISAQESKVTFSGVSKSDSTLWLVATKGEGEPHYYKLTVKFPTDAAVKSVTVEPDKLSLSFI